MKNRFNLKLDENATSNEELEKLAENVIKYSLKTGELMGIYGLISEVCNGTDCKGRSRPSLSKLCPVRSWFIYMLYRTIQA